MSDILQTITHLQDQLKVGLSPSSYDSYLDNLKDWFAQRVTKDLFEYEISQILDEQGMEIHNEIMKQMLFLLSGAPPPPPKMFVVKCWQPVVEPCGVEEEVQGGEMMLYDAGGEEEDARAQQEIEYVTINFVEPEDYNTPEEDPLDIKESDMDWICSAKVIKVDAEELNETSAFSPPTSYTDLMMALEEQKPSRLGRTADALSNVTFGYDISDRLNKHPHLKLHFRQPRKDKPQAYLPGHSTIHGRFLMKAWECGLDGVDPSCTRMLIVTVKEHIRKLVIEIVKQRRAFRMREGRVCHSIGANYPNPYLRQGHHLHDMIYSSESTKLADVMQIPKLLPVKEDLQRLAAIEAAASLPQKQSRFPSTMATLADLLNVIENDPEIIPYTSLRFKTLLTIGSKYKGYGGRDEEEEDDEENLLDDDMCNLLPIVSY